MKRLDFDTPSGRGFLDATLLKLGESLPGDVLVIHYGGEATWEDAIRLQGQLVEAIGRGLPLRHEVPIVLAADGTTLSWIAKAIRARGVE